MTSDATTLAADLRELAAFAEAHHGDQPLHVLLHGLTVDIPDRLQRAAEWADRLQGIIDTLPTTIDRVPIVPGMTVWVVPGATASCGHAEMLCRAPEQWRVLSVGDGCVVCGTRCGLQPYLSATWLASTQEAAQAEAEKRRQPDDH